MTRDEAENLVLALDVYAREVCRYEYGLPTYNNNSDGMQDHLENMINIVMYLVNKKEK